MKKQQGPINRKKAAQTRKARKALKDEAFSYKNTTRFFSNWDKNISYKPRG